MDIPLVKIEVTPDIALKIRGLAEAGVFAIKTGNAQCNFVNGELKSIKTEVYSYPQAIPQKNIDIVKIIPILDK